MPYKQIPHYTAYEVSKDGVIRKCNSKELVTPTVNTGRKVVCLKSDTRKWKVLSVGRCVLLAYRPIADLWKHEFAQCHFIDGDFENCHLKNLRWKHTTYKPPVKVKNLDRTTFVKIPYYPDYEINLNGQVRNIWTKLVRVGKKNANGYFVAGVSVNDKNYSVGIHRLLAMTFLEHPVDVKGLVINHIDGNPSNNELSNLEWATYARNIKHAYDTGLRSENVLLEGKHLRTGRVYKFMSYGDAARHIGCKTQSLHFWITSTPKFRPYRGYVFKKVSDSRPWPTNMELKKNFEKGRFVTVFAKCLKTGLIKKFQSLRLAADVLETSPATIMNYSRGKKKGKPYKGHIWSVKSSSLLSGPCMK